jgi:uncharacterized protein YlzI (FlbEa/FlbD family)
MIRLTDEDGRVTYLNPDHVTVIESRMYGRGAVIKTTDGKVYTVRETPDEVLAQVTPRIGP